MGNYGHDNNCNYPGSKCECERERMGLGSGGLPSYEEMYKKTKAELFDVQKAHTHFVQHHTEKVRELEDKVKIAVEALELIVSEDNVNELSDKQLVKQSRVLAKNTLKAICSDNVHFHDSNDSRVDLKTRLLRTVNAAENALLEMSAWMGIPERKREKQIHHLMENVKFCAANDLRKVDENQHQGGSK